MRNSDGTAAEPVVGRPMERGPDTELRRLMATDRRMYRILIGFWNEAESRQYLEGKALQPSQLEQLMGQWRSARTAVENLPLFSDQEPEILDFENAEALREAQQVMSRPDCIQVLTGSSWRIKRVEIAKIIAFQPAVDLEYTERQGSTVLTPNDLVSAVKLCFPNTNAQPLAINFDQSQKALLISGINPSLQVTGVQFGPSAATRCLVVSLSISSGPNIVQVTRYRGRYFLTNGYHRVLRLAQAGFSHAPCVIRDGAGLGETGALQPGFFPESLLMSPRPPLFLYFTDMRLAADVPMPSGRKFVRIRPDEFFAVSLNLYRVGSDSDAGNTKPDVRQGAASTSRERGLWRVGDKRRPY